MKIKNRRCFKFADIFLVRRSSLFTYIIPGVCVLFTMATQDLWWLALIIPSFALGWFIGVERWRRVISVLWLVFVWKPEALFAAVLVAGLLTMGIDGFFVDQKEQAEKEALRDEEDAGCVQ